MYVYPPYHNCQQSVRYSEYERDALYFSKVVKALVQWNDHHEIGQYGRPVIMAAYDDNRAAQDVRQYFNESYVPEKPFGAERFDEAAGLLDDIVKTNGMQGLYSFFRVLSNTSDAEHAPTIVDKQRFKKILSDVFVPHFEPRPTEEIVHGVATVGHVIISALAGIIHVPVAAYSAMRYRQLRNRRLERLETPTFEVVDHMMPLMCSMHDIAQHSIDVLNHIQPIEGRPFPAIAPIDTHVLETALERARNSDECNVALR